MRPISFSLDHVGDTALARGHEAVEPAAHGLSYQHSGVVDDMFSADCGQLDHRADEVASIQLSRRSPRLQRQVRLGDRRALPNASGRNAASSTGSRVVAAGTHAMLGTVRPVQMDDDEPTRVREAAGDVRSLNLPLPARSAQRCGLTAHQ
jgi:hypothetical protein